MVTTPVLLIGLTLLSMVNTSKAFPTRYNDCLIEAEQVFLDDVRKTKQNWQDGQKFCENLERHYHASNKCYLRVEQKYEEDYDKAVQNYRLQKRECLKINIFDR